MSSNPFVNTLGFVGSILTLLGLVLTLASGGVGLAILAIGIIGVFFWLHAAAAEWRAMRHQAVTPEASIPADRG